MGDRRGDSLSGALERAYTYLRLREAVAVPSTGLALLVRNPLVETQLMPGEYLPVVLKMDEQAAAVTWLVLEDEEREDCGRRGTLVKVEAACHPNGDNGQGEHPRWPSMVMAVATNRVSYDSTRSRNLPHHGFIKLEDLELDIPTTNRTMQELIRQNLTQLDNRLILRLGHDEGTMRTKLVERLRSLGKTTVFQTGQEVTDPDLDLKGVLSLARSLMTDHDREQDEAKEISGIINVLDSLRTKDIHCAWCRHRVCAATDLVLNRFGFHVNRFGYQCRLLLSRICQNIQPETHHDDPQTEDSWFQGFGWTGVECDVCRNFLGFQYHCDDQRSRCLFGFISTRVI